MKKKTEIQQIDFYGILSRETKVISNSNSNPVVIVQKDTPEHFDLEIRSQIHGYNLDLESMNQARDLIGHDHIPLRSIRVPIVPKLSSAWAPNGYGKTYIFSHLQGLSNYLDLNQVLKSNQLKSMALHLQLAWQEERDRLHEENPASFNLVPYHSMGLIFKHGDSRYALLHLYTSSTILKQKESQGGKTDAKLFYEPRLVIRRMKTEENLDDSEWDDVEEGWAYQDSKEWIELDLDAESADVASDYHGIATEALQEFVNMNVLYHETPSLSEKTTFSKIISTINGDDEGKFNELEEKELFDQWSSFGEIFGRPFRFEENKKTPFEWENVFKSIPMGDAQLVVQLEYLAEVLDMLTNPMIMHSDAFDARTAETSFASFLKQDLLSLKVEQMNGFNPVLEILAIVRRILFTESSHNRHLRRQLVHKLLMDIEEFCEIKGDSSHPLRTMLDVMLREHDFEFKTPPEEIHTPKRPTVYSSFCEKRRTNSKVDSDRLPWPKFARTSGTNLDFYLEGVNNYDNDDTSYGFVDMWPFCFDPKLPKGYRQEIPPEASVLATNEWMRTWKNHLIRKLLKTLRHDPFYFRSRASTRLFDLLEGYLDRGREGNSGMYLEAIEELDVDERLQPQHKETLQRDFHYLNDNEPFFGDENAPDEELVNSVFSSSRIPLKENLSLMQEEINRCLNPDDEESPSPWGVETKIDFENPDLVDFQPQGMKDNSILPEHLSFGMRSDITLQFIISRFLYECRRLKCENDKGFHLLILDEPEIGRAEYWVNLLIARFRRFHTQLNDDLAGGVLLVSHRSKVLEQSSPDGGYTLMQKIPLQVDDEMDDDW